MSSLVISPLELLTSNRSTPWKVFLLISIALHLLALIYWPSKNTVSARKALEISFLPLPVTKTPQVVEKRNLQQIVSPPEKPLNQKPLDKSFFLSDMNSSVEKNQIKRGEVEAKNTVQTKKYPELDKTEHKDIGMETETENLPRKSSLVAHPDTSSAPSPTIKSPKSIFLSSKQTALMLGSGKPAASTEAQPWQQQKSDDYQPYRPSSRSLLAGSQDYLPEVPDGELTFLNTKAHAFAPFVRRVATNVFGALKNSIWTQVPTSEIRHASEFGVVEAILDPQGKLLSVKLKNRSGSGLFDNSLNDAVSSGAWDNNPPQGALANDGNIHLIFQARIWSRPAPNLRGEQRWILLSTGLL